MTYYALFVIGIAERVVHTAGITSRLDEAWIAALMVEAPTILGRSCALRDGLAFPHC